MSTGGRILVTPRSLTEAEGTDRIDLDAADRGGVRICRAAAANAQGVAELALTLVLCALRDLPWTSEALRQGRRQRRPGSEMADCTIGVVGLGAVGRRAATLFGALGARVVAHDPFVTDMAVRHLGGYTHGIVRRATSLAVQNLVAVLEEDA
jgi:phosphoglycerate dehydrogenase-like enzyme